MSLDNQGRVEIHISEPLLQRGRERSEVEYQVRCRSYLRGRSWAGGTSRCGVLHLPSNAILVSSRLSIQPAYPPTAPCL
jgi:hypothetical protein